MVEQTPLGAIEVSNNAIESLITHAVAHTYGIVGMSTSTLARGIAATITRDPNRGIRVSVDGENALTIDVYVIIQYGINIASVANNLINAVRYQVLQSTNLTVNQVNVYVQGVRRL